MSSRKAREALKRDLGWRRQGAWPEFPKEHFDVYRCIVLKWWGEFHVQRAGNGEPRADLPAALGEACMAHDRGNNTVHLFDTHLVLLDADWEALQELEEGKIGLEQACRRLRGSKRCVSGHWMKPEVLASARHFSLICSGGTPPGVAATSSCVVVRSPGGFAEAVVDRKQEMARRYPEAKIGSDNPLFDLGHLDCFTMFHHPPVRRSHDPLETRLRSPIQHDLPLSPGEHSDQALHYKQLAISRLAMPGLTLKEANELWWVNARGISPPHDHVPTNDASNVLLNFADMVLGASNVPRIAGTQRPALVETALRRRHGNKPRRSASYGKKPHRSASCGFWIALLVFLWYLGPFMLPRSLP